jgi:hypothetical protein
MKKLDRIAAYASFMTLGIAFVFLLTCIFWLVWPYKPAVINRAIVLDSQVQAGGFLEYQIDYCKYMDLTAEANRAFINGVIFTVPAVITNNPTGCHVNTHQISVPSELPSGTYSLKTVWTYQVNPIRKVTVTYTTAPFKINGSDLDRQQDQL